MLLTLKANPHLNLVLSQGEAGEVGNLPQHSLLIAFQILVPEQHVFLPKVCAMFLLPVEHEVRLVSPLPPGLKHLKKSTV